MFEIGPGHGTLGELAVKAGWHYTAVETSPLLIDVLRKKGLNVIESWTPPMPMADASADVVYADQILEHMRGIDDARQFTAEALRSLRPGGLFFVVVPNYLKEREFFWDVDYTHNFVTTPRRMQQLLYDGGFEILHLERGIGVSTGLARDVLSAATLFVNVPGVDTLSRYTGTEDLTLQDPQEPVRNADVRRSQSPKPRPKSQAPNDRSPRDHRGDSRVSRNPHRHGRGRARHGGHQPSALDPRAADGRSRSRGDDPAMGPAAAGQRQPDLHGRRHAPVPGQLVRRQLPAGRCGRRCGARVRTGTRHHVPGTRHEARGTSSAGCEAPRVGGRRSAAWDRLAGPDGDHRRHRLGAGRPHDWRIAAGIVGGAPRLRGRVLGQRLDALDDPSTSARGLRHPSGPAAHGRGGSLSRSAWRAGPCPRLVDRRPGAAHHPGLRAGPRPRDDGAVHILSCSSCRWAC